MRRIIASVLVLVLATGGASPSLLATRGEHGQSRGATLVGETKTASGELLPNHKVRLRDVTTGDLVGETFSNSAATFAFVDLPPGAYVLEIVNAAGKIIGLSSLITVPAGVTVSVTVAANAAGAVGAAAAGGGLSLLGLGTVASVAVVAAAGALAVAAVVVTRREASVSR